ncbi:MAG: DUF3800 domain-containing protein, partial [bacterium]
LKESEAGRLMRVIFAMKRNLLAGLPLTPAEREGKAAALLDRRSITRVAPKREYAEQLFEMLRDFPLTIFGIVMERPAHVLYSAPGFLQTQYRWLLERIERFMERDHPDDFAIPIFDGQDPSSNHIFSDSFTGYMVRTEGGRALKQIVPSPLFVDSSLTPGIQVADVCAYVTRLNHEENLYQREIVGDPYLSAIKRYAAVVRQKTINFERDDGLNIYGIGTMDPRKFVYVGPHAEAGQPEPEPPAELSPVPAAEPVPEPTEG